MSLPLTARGFVARGNHEKSVCTDEFIAFVEMEDRVLETAQCRGQSKITKTGDREVGRLPTPCSVDATRYGSPIA